MASSKFTDDAQAASTFATRFKIYQMRGWLLAEVCEFLNVSHSTLYREIKDGKLETYKVRGSVRVRHSKLVEWLGFDPLEEIAQSSQHVDSGDADEE